MGALVFALAVAALGASVAGQAPKDSGGKGIVPRIANGKPDLQGVWDFRTLTPLQRPTDLAGKEVLTDAEAVEYERKNALNQDNRESKPTTVQNGAASTTDVDRAYNDFWWDFGKKVVGTKRTSLIVDPPDGRMPALTPEAQARSSSSRPTSALPWVPKIEAWASGASWDSTPDRRCCRARTTTTSRSSRRLTTSCW